MYMRELGLDPDRVNVNGGSTSIGELLGVAQRHVLPRVQAVVATPSCPTAVLAVGTGCGANCPPANPDSSHRFAPADVTHRPGRVRPLMSRVRRILNRR